MENNYLLAPTIERLFGVYADHPQGSLFISGPKESDLSGVLDYLLNLIYAPHGVQPGQVYNLEKHAIEAVRNLLSRLSKTRFDSAKERMVVITDCDRLDLVAQNALLKGLEEPPPGSHFLLTSNKPWEVLPTILSRCQAIRMKKPLKADLFKSWPDQSREVLEEAYWATDGWPVLMKEYLGRDEIGIRHEIGLAKKFLQLDSSQKMRFLFAKGAPTEKADLSEFLEKLLNGLWRIARAALLSSASKEDRQKTAFWREKFLLINDLKSDFEKNLNHKIIILNLGLKL